MSETTKENLLHLPNSSERFAVFTPELRKKLEKGLLPFVEDKPKVARQAVDDMEAIICTHLVSYAQGVGTRLANFIFGRVQQ